MYSFKCLIFLASVVFQIVQPIQFISNNQRVQPKQRKDPYTDHLVLYPWGSPIYQTSHPSNIRGDRH